MMAASINLQPPPHRGRMERDMERDMGNNIQIKHHTRDMRHESAL